MAWNFHLFSNLVSICCENVSKRFKFRLSHFWVCFNLFQLIPYIIYMFQCFETKNIWPGIFTFSLTLFPFVAKRFKFRLNHFWVCFNLIPYIIYMFHCFKTKSIRPGIFTFSLTLFQFVAKRIETFRIRTCLFWVCCTLFYLITISSICFNVSQQKIYGLEFSPFL